MKTTEVLNNVAAAFICLRLEQGGSAEADSDKRVLAAHEAEDHVTEAVKAHTALVAVAFAAKALLEVPEVRKASANWASSELLALRESLASVGPVFPTIHGHYPAYLARNTGD